MLKRPPPATPSYGPAGSSGCPGPWRRPVPRALRPQHHAGELPQLVGVHEEVAELGRVRHAAPVDAAVVAGELHAQPVEGGRQVRSAELHALHQRAAAGFDLRRHRRHVRGRHAHAGQRRRHERERLRLRGPLERHLARRHRPLLDGIDGLAGGAIEEEQQPQLAGHGDGGDRLAGARHVEEHRSGSEIGVPDVVMRQLEVPEVGAGVRSGGDQAGPEQVVAGPIAPVLIDRRRPERHVDDAPRRVHREEAPHVDARAVLPAVAAPGVVEALARLRHRSERPGQLAGVHVPGAHVAGRSARRVLLRRAAGDHEVLVDERRRGQAVAPRQAAEDLGRVEADDAAVAEGAIGRAGRGVDRVELRVAGPEDDLRRGGGITGPVLQAARRRVARGQLERPLLLARRRIERDHAGVRRGHVEDAADDQRRALARGEAASAARLVRTGGRRAGLNRGRRGGWLARRGRRRGRRRLVPGRERGLGRGRCRRRPARPASCGRPTPLPAWTRWPA